MKRKRRVQSHSSFFYSGAGNITSVFNRRPKPAFEKIRSIYGDELERLHYKKNGENKFHQELTEEEKIEIKNRIRASLKKANQLEVLKNILLFCFVIAVFLICYYLIFHMAVK